MLHSYRNVLFYSISKSRKRNLRNKRRQQRKKENGGVQVRPYGTKRRSNKKKSAEAADCVVCKTNAVSHVFVPCGHICVCLRCATILSEETVKRCPKCRTNFTQVIVTYPEPVGD